ncbi:DUF397 domain-containing protein [Thermomonospora curvata]|uniref:DUF397 domain-containing protein n=1 Tax=Thermomonospora curvata TaxID=2020 RepID=UPI000A052AC5
MTARGRPTPSPSSQTRPPSTSRLPLPPGSPRRRPPLPPQRRKPSYTPSNGGDSVEATRFAEDAGTRDSKNRDHGHLTMPLAHLTTPSARPELTPRCLSFPSPAGDRRAGKPVCAAYLMRWHRAFPERANGRSPGPFTLTVRRPESSRYVMARLHVQCLRRARKAGKSVCRSFGSRSMSPSENACLREPAWTKQGLGRPMSASKRWFSASPA